MSVGYIDRARDYVRRVIAREEIAGEFEILACKRFVRDLEKDDDADWKYRFDEELAIRPCAFIEGLHHIKGQWAVGGRLIELEDWQLFLLINLFGWVRRDNGLRRYTTAYWEVARKNSKSTLGAGVGLYMFACDGEPGAEVYSAATTGKQSRIVFNIARAMVERERDFKAAGVTLQKGGVYMPGDERVFEPLNAEGSTLDGMNIHCAVIDELHAHTRRGVYDVIDTARGARSQSLLLGITTAGVNRAGICFEQRNYLVNVLRQIFVDENYFGVIFTIDDGDDWTDPRVWRKANPNYGISVLTDDFEQAQRRALNNISARNNFLTKRLNVWVSNEHAWMDMRLWGKCAQPGIKPFDFKHLPCFMGLDLASKLDIAALATVFVDYEEDKYYLFVKYYLCEKAVEDSSNSQYEGWQQEGLLVVTPGNATDHDVIERDLLADCELYEDVRAVAIDPHNAVQFTSHMLSQSVPMVTIHQRVQYLSEPLKQLQAFAYTGRLVHDGNRITDWMASNVLVKPDLNDNIFPRKLRAENKIDGIVAAILALGRAMEPAQMDLTDFINEPVIG